MIWSFFRLCLWFLSDFSFQHKPGFSLDHFNISDISGWFSESSMIYLEASNVLTWTRPKSLILRVMKLAPKWRVFFRSIFWRCQCVLIWFFFDGEFRGIPGWEVSPKILFLKRQNGQIGSTFMMLPKSTHFFHFPPSIHPSLIHPSIPFRCASEEARSSSTISKQSVMPFTWCYCSVEFWALLVVFVSGLGVWHPDIIRELVEDQKKVSLDLYTVDVF